ncbi:MAG TPA: protein kinase [Vicinamibacterales bacterium]|nr:protein kinase [Vicinamibacterales bacterium]
MIGTRFAHYEVLAKLGEGGMGVVYLADDLRLDRKVALKFLAADASDPHGVERLRREARVASALDHPNIATVYEIDEWEGRTFVAMAYYAGETLSARLARGRLDYDEAATIVEQIADGLAAAHGAGIVHRDLKPANVIITPSGQVKILDFGLAKHIDAPEDETAAAMTRAGSVVGTLAYMSPEQAKGLQVDARTDVWALGVVAYEAVAGHRPFESQSSTGLAIALASETPASIRQIRPDVPAELERVIHAALEKDPARRTITAAEIAASMRRLRGGVRAAGSPAGRTRRRLIAGIAALVVVAAGAFAAWKYTSGRADREWARTEAPAEAARLMQAQEYMAAYEVAERARPYLEPAEFAKLQNTVTRAVAVTTSPEGAEVWFASYDAADSAWHRLGAAPIKDARVPDGLLRWRIEKPGYEPTEDVLDAASFKATLDLAGARASGMVRATGPASATSFMIQGTRLDSPPFADYWIGRHEVTNKQYKAFMDAGGYTTRTYWKQPFTRDGKTLTWEEGMAAFRDATGQPGPAAWELGRYPAGQDELPVAGVSWYEAAAFAEFSGADLPTIHHWQRVAAYNAVITDVMSRAVFNTTAPAPVGTSGARHRFGTFDLAGNIKEWIANGADADRRYALGGAYDEPAYMFGTADPRSAWDRVPTIGFRLAKYDAADAALAGLKSPVPVAPDLVLPKPVGDDVFAAYARAFSYEKTPIADLTREPIDTTPADWTRETVSFAAPYGRERITVHILLPKGSRPPYQPVIYIPGGAAWQSNSIPAYVTNPLAAFVVRSGRALVLPILKGTFERADGKPIPDTILDTIRWRDTVVACAKDISRTIDYLETRQDMAIDKIAYFGYSRGAAFGPVFLALEPRFKVATFMIPGFHRSVAMPEIHPINFAGRMKQPVLVLNGRFDPIFPVTISQLPFYRSLGPAEPLKHRIEYDTGHGLPVNESIKETLAWFDRYLGAVK